MLISNNLIRNRINNFLSIMNSVLITRETHVGKKTVLKVICVGQDLMGLSMERIAGALKV